MPSYMRIDDDDKTLQGDVLRNGKRWTLINSVSFDTTARFEPPVQSPDKAKVHASRTVYVSLPVTPNSQPFLRRASDGTDLGDVLIDVVDDKNDRILRYTLVGTIVASSSFGGGRPGEQTQMLTLNCASSKFELAVV